MIFITRLQSSLYSDFFIEVEMYSSWLVLQVGTTGTRKLLAHQYHTILFITVFWQMYKTGTIISAYLANTYVNLLYIIVIIEGTAY